jgi:hypothetical protein
MIVPTSPVLSTRFPAAHMDRVPGTRVIHDHRDFSHLLQGQNGAN